jgi:hypothetical protein
MREATQGFSMGSGNRRGGRKHEISADMPKFFGGMGGGGGPSSSGNGLSSTCMESLQQAEKVSSLTACECNHGLMVEALKKFIFSQKKK